MPDEPEYVELPKEKITCPDCGSTVWAIYVTGTEDSPIIQCNGCQGVRLLEVNAE